MAGLDFDNINVVVDEHGAQSIAELANIFGVDATWDGVSGKPSVFPPADHNHNDLYYQKSESDGMYFNKSDAEIYADFHNANPRGKNITAYLTDGSLWDRIKGTNGFKLFEDLFVGDYLTADGQEYMIVDFDYYIRTGINSINFHHLVMMPRENMSIPEETKLYGSNETLMFINTARAGVTVTNQETETEKKWNATMEAPNANSTAGGYKFSRMRRVILRAADTIVINAFGTDHVWPLVALYPNPADANADGLASNIIWFKNNDWTAPDRKSICDLPNEVQIYGYPVWGRGIDYINAGHEIGLDKWQFSFFRYNRNFANIRDNWWLRSVATASTAAYVSSSGSANNDGAASANGVRPRFLLF